MNFLNEAANRYPTAISFASGRPAESFFSLERWLGAVPVFLDHMARKNGSSVSLAEKRLAQYGPTAGIIEALVAEQLRIDEHIACEPERVVVTAGCQEALSLLIPALCRAPGDVVLARNPTYIGATGVADFAGIEIMPVEPLAGEDWARTLARVAAELRHAGKTPRGLYLTPEFDNPTGTVLNEEQRRSIIAGCVEHRIVVLEDNPYGMFRFEGATTPAMAALDDAGCVVYLATYSKTLCPAVRVGAAVVPKRLFGSASEADRLLAELSERKSFVTVNTSQVTQAIVGGVLLEQQGSLRAMVERPRLHYRRNRDALLSALHLAFGARNGEVSWNRPAGGFFLSLSLPFEFAREQTAACARDHGVIVMPMTFFTLDETHRREVRLAFSNTEESEIEAGVERLARYVDAQTSLVH
ncbi:PLP-dependent aminotransferase family protein [Trinickia diaoshuihuensis]|jgi:(S)-3,5-dihydroxyphenylglycine transaminase|uniref:aminotransferase-like domain-containing protein n=1 Tax=Trinickia diaoshuihuensis TaxID=2292265 RepID=UPI001F07FB86|nr:PLP-dependent aminotransferase family protein [Trinickia diaoshuihuensis]